MAEWSQYGMTFRSELPRKQWEEIEEDVEEFDGNPSPYDADPGLVIDIEEIDVDEDLGRPRVFS